CAPAGVSSASEQQGLTVTSSSARAPPASRPCCRGGADPMTPVTFSIEKTRFDENYRPLGNTRLTTNFANLARGENRQQTLRSALKMIDDRFNELARQDNEEGERYSVVRDSVSVNAALDGGGGRAPLPLIEMLQTSVVDRRLYRCIAGIVGIILSPYVRDSE